VKYEILYCGYPLEGKMVLGIDIGATKTWVGHLRGMTLLKSRKMKTQKNPELFLGQLRILIEEFIGRSQISGIGIGAPGPVDPINGIFGKLPNLPTWDGFTMRKSIENLFQVPVKIHNDANAAALGETIYGGGRGYACVYYITISTGIGGGFIFERSIVTGKNHLTGEIWAMPVQNLGEPDILINTSSGPGIVRNVKKLMQKGESTSLASLNRFDTKDVFEHAERGDPVATRVIDNAIENMMYCIITILLALDPDVILIGGGLAREDKYMIRPLKRTLLQRAYFKQHAHANIQKAVLWDEAVLYGAISLFHEQEVKR
jgi:glucokinase